MSLIAPMGEDYRGNFKRNLFFIEKKVGFLLRDIKYVIMFTSYYYNLWLLQNKQKLWVLL